MAKARRVVVNGRVQGVFFRAWSKEQADQLGITGWVRNRSDGSVEAHLEGSDEAVAQMTGRLRIGPPHADVQHLSIEESTLERTGTFQIRH